MDNPERSLDGAPAPFDLPLDLGELVDRQQLALWVQEAVDAFDWNQPAVAEHARRCAVHPRVMLQILGLAYLSQTFASNEIARRCYTDPVFRKLCGDVAPMKAEISRFRRENRGLLKAVVYATLLRLVRETSDLEGPWIPAGVRRHLQEAAVERINLGRHMDRSDDWG